MTRDKLLKLKVFAGQVFKSGEHSELSVHLLHYIMSELCGYDCSGKFINSVTSDICPNSIIWNESRRDVWLHLRDILPRELLEKVEINYIPLKMKSKEVAKKKQHPHLTYKPMKEPRNV